jgi:hypothetical protein
LAANGGGVVCCGGKKFSCTSVGDQVDKKYPTDTDAGAKAAKGIIEDCAQQHEDGHHQDVECPAGGGPEMAKWKDPSEEGVKGAEGREHSKEIMCLAKALDKCKGDPGCEQSVRERAKRLAGHAQEQGYPLDFK